MVKELPRFVEGNVLAEGCSETYFVVVHSRPQRMRGPDGSIETFLGDRLGAAQPFLPLAQKFARSRVVGLYNGAVMTAARLGYRDGKSSQIVDGIRSK